VIGFLLTLTIERCDSAVVFSSVRFRRLAAGGPLEVGVGS